MSALSITSQVISSVLGVITLATICRGWISKHANKEKTPNASDGVLKKVATKVKGEKPPGEKHRNLTSWEGWINGVIGLIGSGIFIWAAFYFKPGNELGTRLIVLGLALQGISIVYRRIAENPSSSRIKETSFIVALVLLVGMVVAVPLMTIIARVSNDSASSSNATYNALKAEVTGTAKVEKTQLGTFKSLEGWLKQMGDSQNYIQEQVFDVRAELGKEQTQIKRLQDELRRLRSKNSASTQDGRPLAQTAKAPHSSTT